jgi:mRNA-degrading endonuclease toxin of MazEF toxin-antitoxin module
VVSNNAYNARSADFIAIPLTSNLQVRRHAVKITNKDLEDGELIVESLVKVDKIFSVEKSLAKKKIGKIKRDVYQDIKHLILEIIN